MFRGSDQFCRGNFVAGKQFEMICYGNEWITLKLILGSVNMYWFLLAEDCKQWQNFALVVYLCWFSLFCFTLAVWLFDWLKSVVLLFI
jgi:TM2 domain-containing membrane protein YozV